MMEEEVEDCSVISSPPRSASKSRLSYTPRSRRLVFDEDQDDQDSDLRQNLHQSSLSTHYHHHRPSSSVAPIATKIDYYSGRKRSSGDSAIGSSSTHTPHRNSMDTDSSNSAPGSAFSSPHISPNSYLTMDGRFVHSKNPFSSPMVTETNDHEHLDHCGAPTTAQHAQGAPSLPVNFYGGTSSSKGFLPPRVSSTPSAPLFHDHHGYPHKKFSFTGSPILEDSSSPEQATGQPVSSSSLLHAMEASSAAGPASNGSLNKVRRFNKTDDVCKASGQHFANKRQQLLSVATNNLTSNFDTDEISPTDVTSFPPPTPVKAKQTYPPPYASIRRLEPPTPIMERRRRPAPPLAQSHGATPTRNSQHTTNTSPKSRFHTDFDIIGELGKGSFGTVFKVLSRLDGCMYAIKTAQRQAKGQADKDRMLKEVYALAALSDQADTATFHIVRYHQAWMEDDRLYIQTELCTGNLTDEISKGRLKPLNRRFKVMREISLALSFIHRNNMVHLDIKPENIFIKNDQFKLGDFGLVTKASTHQDVEEGDSRYMSMELLSGDHLDLTKSDIFSLGATMYEICLGRELPMNGDEWQAIRSGNLLPLPGSDPELVQLIHEMMHPNYHQRPTASNLLKRPQLLSDEEKALIAEKSKVAQANMELAAQAQKFKQLSPKVPMPRKGLQRANTWNGSSFPNPFPF